MKNILKLPVLILLILIITIFTVIGACALSPVKYDAASEGIVSAYYNIDRVNGFITGIVPGTTSQKDLSVCVPAGTASQESLTTGTAITASSPDGQALTLTAILTGDLNGDGYVTITDMLMLKSSILGEVLPDTAIAASDINYDGSVTITDFLKVKSNLLGLEPIIAAPSVASDPIVLMVPGSSEVWYSGLTAGAVSFVCDNDTTAAIAPDGTITAGTGEGSTFVYALDGGGNILTRAMVTVLNEPLYISLNASSHMLFMGQSLTLTPSFNHPVSPAITWTSSDPSVVTVENGTLTAQNFGTATVTAALNNGNYAQTAVTVAPPLTNISFYKSLFKLKPGSSRTLELWLNPADTGEEILWSSSNPAIATVDASGTVTGVNYGTVTITATGKYSGLSASCNVKICDVKQVAITFDDGPSSNTPRLLDFFKANELKATFFLVANRVSTYPDTVIREVTEGHEIGYHSYAHVEQTTLSSEQITSDFQYSNQILMDLTGCGFTVWRTPGGGYNDRVLAAVPLPHIMWSVDTMDWSSRNADSVYWSIINSSKDGSIILLHDLYGSTVDGAIRAMAEMYAGDYEFLTVTELLSRNGTAPQASTTYHYG